MLIQNGTIITDKSSIKTDLRIKDGIITEIAANLIPESNEEIVNAGGMLVMPGGIDVHTHMDLDVGIARATDDFYTGTVAAACGGTTTIVDHMAFGPEGCSIRHQLDHYHTLAQGKAVIDYSFHGVIGHVDDAILKEVEDLVGEGITSHKFYLTYGQKLTDREFFLLMRKAKELGIMLTAHPENHDMVGCLKELLIEHGKTSPIYHAVSHPVESEAEAINRLILFAHVAEDAPLYIVHLSCEMGLDYIRQARQRGQKNLFAETCPQYLFLDESRYREPGDAGLKYIMSPPLRRTKDNQALWLGLQDGSIQTVATDHCPFFLKGEKQLGKDNFAKTPNGAPGVEPRMALLFSEGVSAGRIDAQRYVEITSTNPAKLFGLYPRKGTLEKGSDGDILIVDPSAQLTLTHSMLHENVDYTPYEGISLRGYPYMTISRGKIVAKEGCFLGEKGAGKFIKRNLPILGNIS